jgi:hypothetical protein
MRLEEIIAQTLARPLPPEISAMARNIVSTRSGVAAVLAYGSCLRGAATRDSLIDLYVLSDGIEDVSANAASRLGCRVAPPNVYYTECEHDGVSYRGKYAVLPVALFERWMRADNPYFWARFAQPSRLVHAADATARRRVVAAIAEAARTMARAARSAAPGESDPLARWSAGFAATYGTELRVETAARASAIVEAERDYYIAVTAALGDIDPLPGSWPGRRARGKLWSVARLTKAAFTFAGGADYLAWKIERHSGQKVELRDWQRRHPVVAGLVLLPRLLKRGTVR